MEVFLYILLALLILLILLFLLAVIILYQPIRLQINSIERKYKLSFVGGHIKYDKVDEDVGIRRKIFFKEEFIPFKNLLIKKEGKPETEKKKKRQRKDVREEEKTSRPSKTAKSTEKRESDFQKLRKILRLAYTERELFRRLAEKTFLALIGTHRAFTLEVLDGRFYVEDPFACGIYYTLLAPFCRNRICLTPSFSNDDYLVFSMYFVPGKVVYQFLKYSLTLPFIRIFRLGWRVYRIVKS
jgi:hypothetical protein